jgi:hypothetical protein
MSLKRLEPIAVLIILGCSLITLFAALKLKNSTLRASQGFAGEGFALLTVDASEPDRAVGEALSAAGIDGSISESTSWVFLDDFAGLKRIPLDAYDEAVEPFDPRNDGYAERLRSFFVKDGKRRFFIDLGATGYGRLEGRVAAVLGDTPFTLDAFVTARPASRLWSLLLFLVAGAATLFLSSRGVPRGFVTLAAALLPVQGALALSGPGGFACSAALLGCFQCLLPPLTEQSLQSLIRRRFKIERVFKMNWRLAFLFLLVFIVAALFASVQPLVAALAGISGFIAFGLFLRLESGRETGPVHRRFLPVPIREPSFSFAMMPRITLPFAAASFLALFLPLVSGQPAASPNPASLAAALEFPSEEEYRAHFAYQSSFSLRPLAAPGAGRPESYHGYYLGEDGLIAGSQDMQEADPMEAGPEYPQMPPFPLEELSSFLKRGGSYTAVKNRTGDLFAAAAALLMAVPSCFGSVRRRRKTGSFLIFNSKGDGCRVMREPKAKLRSA